LRRAIFALVGTAAGTTLLISLKAGLVIGQPATASAVAPLAGAAQGSAPPAGAGAGGLKDGTFTGSVVQKKWGRVQVQITVSSGRMTDVTALQTPSAHEESLHINGRAAPILRQEALAAQSAVINTVSGATFTSAGYRTSLQAALDAARRG
jgi:uncharacterized protein with FMN-binding domain